jgi:hypothetical protein
LAVLATGAAHIEQYSVNYPTVPTIGTLFLLNFIAAIVIAVGLITPLRRVTGRYTDAVRAAFAVGGIGLAVGSLVGPTRLRDDWPVRVRRARLSNGDRGRDRGRGCRHRFSRTPTSYPTDPDPSQLARHDGLPVRGDPSPRPALYGDQVARSCVGQ